ncbi:MAG: NAD(P)H-hydrate dehydratase [Oscillospiraceae bacterium]|nr:NAD(P)H-hydrate dehydratase [Oscillospiraceae bacterium]
MKELNHQSVLDILPDRDPWAHKGDFGRVLLLCGSCGYTGAAALAAMGALRCGAGLVYLGVPESIYAIEAVKLTEPIVFPLPDCDGMLAAEAVEQINQLLPKMDAVLIGPGLGQSNGTLAALKTVLRQFDRPVVIDADGINLLAKHRYLLRGRTAPTVLTPHDGEFIRLAGELGEDRAAAAGALAQELGCTVVLKGHESLITDGKNCYRNRTGNPGMAVGGSGDVLAGILVSLLGQGIEPIQAAAAAVWLHGAAGDRCARRLGQYGMLPTDLLEELPRLMK